MRSKNLRIYKGRKFWPLARGRVPVRTFGLFPFLVNLGFCFLGILSQ